MQLIIVSLVAWFTAQVTKFSIGAFHSRPDLRLFYRSGGMPSAHSATVAALAVAALTTQGYQSPVFGLATVLAAIVIYDSLGVRRSSGEQSVVLNILLKAAGNSRLVREVLGHKPSEIWAGVFLGLAVGLLLTFADWSDQAGWLVNEPLGIERTAYAVVFSLLVLLGLSARIALGRLRQVKVVYQLKSASWWALVLPGAAGLFTVVVQLQTATAAAWRLWTIIIVTAFVVAHGVLWHRLYRVSKRRYRIQSSDLAEKRKHQRIQQRKSRKSKKRK